MNKRYLFALAAVFLPLSASAIELMPPPIRLLSDSQSFQVADAVKLGLNKDGLALKPKKALTGDDKNTGDLEEFCNRNEGLVYNRVTKKCERIDVCTPNPCKNPTPVCEAAGDGLNYTCSCNETSCGAGKTCVGGTCYNCEKGEKCNCSGNQVSDGNGGCYTPNDPCSSKPCSGETPSCSSLDETQYSCSCTSTSCPDGKECSDMACHACSAGDDCGCSKYGKEADGNGGCRCPGMKISDGAGGCRCPDCYVATTNWGECKKTCECVTCAKAKKCVEGECINCPLGEDCGCSDDDAYSNGSGVCEPKPCPSGYDTSVTSCSEGYTFSTNGTSGWSPCGKCSAKSCPSGYSTSVTSCSEGYTFSTNGMSGDSTCGKCSAKSCPSGYSTSVTSCPSGQKLETNGMSGDSACGKCVEDYECVSNSDCADDEKCTSHKCEKVQCQCNYPDYFNCTISNHSYSCKCKSSVCYHDAYCWQEGQTCLYCGAAGTGVTSDGMCIDIRDGSHFSPLAPQE